MGALNHASKRMEKQDNSTQKQSKASSFKDLIKDWLKKVGVLILLSIGFGVLFAYLFLKVGDTAKDYIENKADYFKEQVSKFVSKINVFNKHKESESKGTQDSIESILNNEAEHLLPRDNKEYNAQNEPIVKVVKKVLPGVVSIAIDQSNILPGPTFINKDTKIGSGFIVDAQKGIIVTNRHVVEDANKYTYKVITYDGKTLQVVKILQDPVNDLAFVFVHPLNNIKLHALPLGDSDALQLGQTVIAIGTPFGEFPSTVTSGIISGLHRKVDAPDVWNYGKTYFDVIQTDAAINPGNSGGPLINLAGEVIGINFAKINGGDNVSFALPINLVKKRLEQYNTYGHFRQAFLGVSIRHLDYATASYYGVPAGDLVVNVIPGSPAAKAGIKPKDIIVEVNGESLADMGLISVLSKYNVEDIVTLKIARPKNTSGVYGITFNTIEVKVRLADRYKFLK